jgi:hypothetical protein
MRSYTPIIQILPLRAKVLLREAYSQDTVKPLKCTITAGEAAACANAVIEGRFLNTIAYLAACAGYPTHFNARGYVCIGRDPNRAQAAA